MSATTQPRQTLTRDAWTRMASEASPSLLALWADTREVYALLRDGDTPLLFNGRGDQELLENLMIQVGGQQL